MSGLPGVGMGLSSTTRDEFQENLVRTARHRIAVAEQGQERLVPLFEDFPSSDIVLTLRIICTSRDKRREHPRRPFVSIIRERRVIGCHLGNRQLTHTSRIHQAANWKPGRPLGKLLPDLEWLRNLGEPVG